MAARKDGRSVRQIYAFIKENQHQYSVERLCRLLEVARSGYYAWLREPLSRRAQEDARLLRLIRASFAASHGVYGAPRVFLDLREAGETCSKHLVARLMRANNLRARSSYRTRFRPTAKPSRLAPNALAGNFNVSRPNKAWVTDITYIRTWQGWLYLAVVVDLFSRRVVGWSTKPTMSRELVLDAVLNAVRLRHPRRAIIHSDQGSQYSSDDWRRFCRSHHLEPSMSRRGHCGDNAVAESFFGSLKKERIRKRIYRNREIARADIADYIESFYNRARRHSYLGGVSPEEFELAGKREHKRVH
jgi:putative transposase